MIKKSLYSENRENERIRMRQRKYIIHIYYVYAINQYHFRLHASHRQYQKISYAANKLVVWLPRTFSFWCDFYFFIGFFIFGIRFKTDRSIFWFTVLWLTFQRHDMSAFWCICYYVNKIRLFKLKFFVSSILIISDDGFFFIWKVFRNIYHCWCFWAHRS